MIKPRLKRNLNKNEEYKDRRIRIMLSYSFNLAEFLTNVAIEAFSENSIKKCAVTSGREKKKRKKRIG